MNTNKWTAYITFLFLLYRFRNYGNYISRQVSDWNEAKISLIKVVCYCMSHVTGYYNSNYNGGTNNYKKPGRLDYTWVLLGTTINTGTNKLYKKRQQLRYTLVLLTTTTKRKTNSNYNQRQLLGTTKYPNYQELHTRATTSYYKKGKQPTTTKNFKD